MDIKLKWSILILGILVAIFLGVVVTKITVIPFLIARDQSIGGIHAKIYNFQPYYLWSYERNNGLFVKVFYIRKGWIPQMGTLWLSGDYGGKNLEAVVLTENNKIKAKLLNKSEVQKYFKFGQRMNAEYLTGKTLEITNAKYDDQICVSVPRICQVFEYAKSKTEKYELFSKGGRLSGNEPLVILMLTTELRQ